ncbi:MAG: patatin-like phospholipase family protein [Solirubrobacterales bacterium]
MRVGLVLGAGGVMGGAWLTGGLDALARETGWDPAEADYLVGTSAGAMIGALCAAGVPPWFMVGFSKGESFEGVTDAEGRPAATADRTGGAVYRVERGALPLAPGSWRLAFNAITRPRSHTPVTMAAGFLPRGIISTEPLREQIRRVVPEGWSNHPGLRIVACDYSSGRRVPFGREGTPQAELADAVAASCAIPGFYRPVAIAGGLYVDGGIYSTSNLDILCDEELDLVICLNPTSSLHPIRAWNPADRIATTWRNASGRKLGSEAKKLRAAGTEVILVQPTGEDMAVMGNNLMSGKRRNEAIDTARMTVAEHLQKHPLRSLLDELPEGRPEKIERPEGDPADWPIVLDQPTR